MPKISIVLPTYNGERFLSQSIESVISQTFTDWELIIVNDCSTDSTSDIVKEYVEKDFRVRCITNKQNQKLPKSLNIGFDEASGEYLTWTSDDNYFHANALERMFNYLESNLNDVMVCARMNFIQEDESFIRVSEKYDEEYMFFHDCVGACFLYRREVLDKLGGYNSERFLVEDYEYWLRILINGGHIGFIDEIMYFYRMQNQSLTETRKADIRCELMRLRCEIWEEIEKRLKSETQLFHIYVEYIESKMKIQKLDHYFFQRFPMITMIEKYSGKNRTIIYGSGELGTKVFKILGEKISFYSDRDKKKVGSEINGIKIISVEEMIEMANQDAEVVLALNPNNMLYALDELKKKGLKKCAICQQLDQWKIE